MVRYEGRCIEAAESVWEPLTRAVYEARKQDEQWEVRVVFVRRTVLQFDSFVLYFSHVGNGSDDQGENDA